MLPPDDQRWASLNHAYGPAADVPAWLRSVRTSPEPGSNSGSESWSRLWSALCHQGDAYTASYAAVPHLVDIARTTSGPIDFSFYALPASIEIARLQGRGPAIPKDLEPDYREAVAGFFEAVDAHRNNAWDQAMLLSAMAAQAVAKGHAEVAEALLELDDLWIEKIRNGNAD